MTLNTRTGDEMELLLSSGNGGKRRKQRCTALAQPGLISTSLLLILCTSHFDIRMNESLNDAIPGVDIGKSGDCPQSHSSRRHA